MAIHATIERQQASTGQRGATRLTMQLEVPSVIGVGAGVGTTVLIHNLSASGLLMETAFALSVGQSIVLTLPEAGEVALEVVWQSKPFVGCRFERPLPRAALSAARLRDPLPSQGIELLPDRLRRLRQQAGLNRAELAALAGISKPSLWAWETGKTVPRATNVRILAEVLGVSEQELVDGSDPGAAYHLEELASETSDQPLHTMVESCKNQIARAAGVNNSQVRISIDF